MRTRPRILTIRPTRRPQLSRIHSAEHARSPQPRHHRSAADLREPAARADVSIDLLRLLRCRRRNVEARSRRRRRGLRRPLRPIPTGPFTNVLPAGTATTYAVDLTQPDMTKRYYFKVMAKNNGGRTASTNVIGRRRPNATKPAAPSAVSTTGSTSGAAKISLRMDLAEQQRQRKSELHPGRRDCSLSDRRRGVEGLPHLPLHGRGQLHRHRRDRRKGSR